MNEIARCWCGNAELLTFSPLYRQCAVCQTLITSATPAQADPQVADDDQDFYGRQYWFEHQEHDLGFTDIVARARSDLSERCLHWLRALLKYKLPPGAALELGGAHSGFAALLRQAGFDATGLELSPWVVEFARRTFDIPMLLGPVENQTLEPGSLDVIALMDVLEHLPDPMGTMRHCLSLLKPDGLLLIQTPRYPAEKSYDDLVAGSDPFLEQFKANEHLFLFSQASIREMFHRLGADHIVFEPAMFGHYDMFLVVSRSPQTERSTEAIEQALSVRPGGRLLQAMLDLRQHVIQQQVELNRLPTLEAQLKHIESQSAERLAVIQEQGQRLGRLPGLEAQIKHLETQLTASQADRAARLEVIQQQGEDLNRLKSELAQAQAEVARLAQQLAIAEADRAARLDVIHQQGAQIGHLTHELVQAETGLRQLENRRAVRLLKRLGLIRTWPTRPPPTPALVVKPEPPEFYEAIREPKHLGGVVYTPESLRHIQQELRSRQFVIQDYTIDVADYRAYFEQADYQHRYPNYYPAHLAEKSLEHYLAARLLKLSSREVYIDIASEGSPVPEIYGRLFGCETYRQDLAYPAGLNDHVIGGDAAQMPVAEGFADKLALHCSFEHFEGDADVRFIREVSRVLKPGGAVCIVPLYLFDRYVIQTDPGVSVPAKMSFEPEAVVYCRPGWNNRHGRFYDPAHLQSRVGQALNGMTLMIYRILNARQVDPSCYVEFAALITKPAAVC